MASPRVRTGLLLSAALLLAVPAAAAERTQVKGSAFVTIMNGNTLLATDERGVRFKAYFVAGGVATYEDETGRTDSGRWRIENGEQVCVAWTGIAGGKERCARVYTEGNAVTWTGDGVSGRGKLLGAVVPGF